MDSEPEPDISVTPGAEEDYTQSHPTTAELVVEIAVSSPALDRVNAALYAEAGIKEYWIVLALERQIEVYRNPSKGGTLSVSPPVARTRSHAPAYPKFGSVLTTCSHKATV